MKGRVAATLSHIGVVLLEFTLHALLWLSSIRKENLHYWETLGTANVS